MCSQCRWHSEWSIKTKFSLTDDAKRCSTLEPHRRTLEAISWIAARQNLDAAEMDEAEVVRAARVDAPNLVTGSGRSIRERNGRADIPAVRPGAKSKARRQAPRAGSAKVARVYPLAWGDSDSDNSSNAHFWSVSSSPLEAASL